MKKARLSFLITFLTVFVTVFATACSLKPDSSSSRPSEVELIFEVPETVELPYYEYYTVPDISVTDTNGNIYISNVKVTNENGKAVDIEEGKFFVIYTENYKIEYSVIFNGENITKTMTGIVADKTAPEVELSSMSLGAFVGEMVTVPECTYSDNMSEDDELNLTFKVTFGETEIAVSDGAFTATEAGVYKATYTVTDKAGNVTEKIAEIGVAMREDGNIAYFNNDYAQLLCGLKTELAASFIERGNDRLASPMGGSSTAISFLNSVSPYGGRLDITAPAITDITGYNYLYLWVYTTYPSGINLAYNNVWMGVHTNVAPEVWTRIVFEKGEDGNFYTAGSDNFASGATARLFNAATDSADINATPLMFLASPLNTDGGDLVEVYYGGLCATNELPELPDGTKEWMPKPRMIVSGIVGSVEQGDTVDPDVSVQFVENATVTAYVSIDGEERKEISSFPYTYETVGTYALTFEASVDGVVLLTKSIEVTVNPVDRNMVTIAKLTSESSVDSYNLVGGWSAESTMAVTPAAAGIVYPVNGEAPIRFNAVTLGGIMINSPAITDVTSYKYLFVDVMIAYGDAQFFIYAYGAPIIDVKGGNTWTRVVYVNDGNGNFVLPGATDNLSAGDGHDGTHVAFENPASVSAAFLMVRAVDNWAYFGQFSACNELPELPEGFETNYYARTIADFTDENAISAYELSGNFGAGIVYDANENCVRMDSNPDGIYTGMVIKNPDISDISKFKYVYIDVKVAWGDANFVFNFAWGAPYLTLSGNGTWTRVVAENDGSGKFTIIGASGNMSDGQPIDASIFGTDGAMTSLNIAGMGVHILSGGNNVYFKNFVACNQLPTLPQGMASNYVAS